MAVTYPSVIFSQFFESFEAKLFKAANKKKFYQIGELVLEVIFFQENMHFFGDSLAHLEIKPCYSNFRIMVVSQNDTAIFPPNAFWSNEIIGTDGVITCDSQQFMAHYNSVANFFQVSDNVNCKAIYWLENETKIPDWERSFSFRWILHHFTEKANYCMIHAASLGQLNGGIILPAKSGSGKSNTSLSCVGTNINYMGDDFVLVDTNTLVAYSLYNCAKVEPSRIKYFPLLSDYFLQNFGNSKMDKKHVYLFPKFKNYLINKFHIKAIVIPNFTGSTKSELVLANATNALIAMAPTTIGVLKATNNTFKKMAKLAKELPIYQLNTGTDLKEIPEKIELLLSEINLLEKK